MRPDIASRIFTSPHLLRFNERIRVAGVDASDAEIVHAFGLIDQARGSVSLTYFEFAALAALLIFEASEPDFVILEVGLGGRLDAVNIVDASVAVITSIDLDHQGWLGESRGEISREKAGILRRGRPAVIADSNPPPELLDCVVECGRQPGSVSGARVFGSRGGRTVASSATDARRCVQGRCRRLQMESCCPRILGRRCRLRCCWALSSVMVV